MRYLIHTTQGFKNTRIHAKVNDTVVIRTGYWHGEIGIIMALDEDDMRVKVRVIKSGIDLNLKIKAVLFDSHNTDKEARAYYDLAERMRQRLTDQYSDIDYIKEHWNDDSMILNDITATTICNLAHIYVGPKDEGYDIRCLKWISDNKDLIDIAIRYNSVDFVTKMYKSHLFDNDYNHKDFLKLNKLFYGEK